MATPAQALAAIATKLEASPVSATRRASDYRDDLDRLTAGTLYYQLQGFPIAMADRSGANVRLQLAVFLKYRLDGTEVAWTEGGLQTALAAIVDPTYWSTVSGVAGLGDLAEIEVERVGHVITATLELQLEVTNS